MKLTEEQKQVIDGLLQFKKPVQVMSGYAGTGKTTVISHIIKKLPGFAVCAFTGKAADVLRRKGVPATTIHSLIYTPVVGADGKIAKDKYGNPLFSIADKLGCDGIIVDEASTVNQKLYEDLLSFGLNIIFVGDGAQLEPVGTDINVMAHPDFTLQTIHRNAGEIAFFGEFIRAGYKPAAFAQRYPCKKIKFINHWEADRHLLHANQVICAYNKTRVQLNARIRFGKGFPTGQPVTGDRIMCLRNSRQIGLFNGMQGKIDYLYHRENRMRFATDDNTFEIPFDPSQFGKEKYNLDDYHKDDPLPFDWCDCVTVHKSQGSEWDNVMVFEQVCKKWDHRRWAYTAATRAKEGLVWVAY